MKTEPIIELLPQGGYLISDIIGNQRYKCQYYGLTRKETRREFIAGHADLYRQQAQGWAMINTHQRS